MMTRAELQVSVGQRCVVGIGSVVVGALILGMLGRADAEHAGVSSKALVDGTVVSYTPVRELSGRLTIAGSDTMQPLMAKLGAEFTRRYPDVQIAVEGGGSTAAIREFVIGFSQQRRGEKSREGHDGATQVRVLASSRELSPEEVKAFASTNGYEPLRITVAADAVAIYVHPDNPVQGLTLEQIDAIFSETRKRGYHEQIKTWGQLGLKDGWEQQPIRLYGRNRQSGTHDFFEHVALNGGKLRDDVKMAAGSASEILAIARDPLGIGFAGIGIQSSYVRVVPLTLNLKDRFVPPTAESVRDGSYPFSRFLYLYLNQAPKTNFEPVLREFLRFIDSRDGQETVARARFFTLPMYEIAQNLNVINGGTLATSLPANPN